MTHTNEPPGFPGRFSIAAGMASVALAAPQEKTPSPDVATLDRITVTAQSRE